MKIELETKLEIVDIIVILAFMLISSVVFHFSGVIVFGEDPVWHSWIMGAVIGSAYGIGFSSGQKDIKQKK